MGKTYIGIDIGTNAVKLALCSNGAIRRLAVEQLPDNLVKEGRVVSSEAMASFLKDTLRQHHLSGRHCALVIPSTEAFSRRLMMPAMTVEHLKLNLPYEFRDYITQEKDKYFYDYALLEMIYDEEGQPQEMELMAAATLKSTIHEYTEMMRRAGLKLAIAAPEEFAYCNILREYESAHPQQGQREYCIIDLGHTATRVHIFSGSRFEATRVIDYGGAMVDRAIADTLNIDEHIARERKLANQNGELLLEPCQNIYATVAIEIMRAINFYSFNNPGSQITEAFVCGGGASVRPLLERIQETTKLTIKSIRSIIPAFDGHEGDLALFPTAIGITRQ